MPESQTPLTEQLDRLRQTRDELRLQVHLGADEAREEWERAEVLWGRLQAEVQRLGQASKGPSKVIRNAAATLIHQVGISYGHIRMALQRPA